VSKNNEKKRRRGRENLFDEQQPLVERKNEGKKRKKKKDKQTAEGMLLLGVGIGFFVVAVLTLIALVVCFVSWNTSKFWLDCLVFPLFSFPSFHFSLICTASSAFVLFVFLFFLLLPKGDDGDDYESEVDFVVCLFVFSFPLRGSFFQLQDYDWGVLARGLLGFGLSLSLCIGWGFFLISFALPQRNSVTWL
jgi:hypothetical protein